MCLIQLHLSLHRSLHDVVCSTGLTLFTLRSFGLKQDDVVRTDEIGLTKHDDVVRTDEADVVRTDETNA